MKNRNPFDECPIYETENLMFTKVKIEDSEELFKCYSDPITKGHMNNDNCGGEWLCNSIDVVKQGIRGWESEFDDRFYIRWSVNHKSKKKIIGTIEISPVPNTTRFLDEVCKTGILRIDVISHLEIEPIFSEILKMTTDNFYSDFGIENIIIKATQDDKQRTLALDNNNFERLEDYKIIRYPNYYIKKQSSNKFIEYGVIKSRDSSSVNPIVLKKGDKVLCTEESDPKGDWAGWIYCISNDNEGWVPKQIINQNRDIGSVIEDYDAREFDIEVDEIIIMEKELNGWIWGFKKEDPLIKAWAPLNHLEEL